ncbi:hypothetical protein GDO78_000585 [Eleutherodactylus coqui]|uniref:Uncharacterized protein n=1 Tax=Eleutherodactylus coqui TaxID=57060 RepID=A0A8J6FQF1_ELECQ|nr:hypothetical protein GDO78_000585 [Eleutherodactylus coqui]
MYSNVYLGSLTIVYFLINSRSSKSNKTSKQLLVMIFQKSELPKIFHNSTQVVLKYDIFKNTALIRMTHSYRIQVFCTNVNKTS